MNYHDYCQERVDEIFSDPKHLSFVEDIMIDELVGYNLVAMANSTEIRDGVFDTVVERVKKAIAEHFEDMIVDEYNDLEREYAQDMAVDRMKDPD